MHALTKFKQCLVLLKYKKNSELIIQSTNNSNKYILNVVREDGSHISSYSITRIRLEKIAKDGFWIWQNSTLNR
jgi:hypothetical protein